mgnify:FL=1
MIMEVPKKDRPFVFVRCLTYNHEKYIEDALKGFVMQKTDFPFLAVVIDDCSTDGTADIVRRYEAQYPDIIKGIYLPHNFRQTREDKRPYYQEYVDKATYWAECEGDDYWTDPYKLQKQVDFMEAHPECTVTFHRYDILQQEEQKWRKDRCGVYLQQNQDFVELTLPMYFENWVTQPCTMIYRKGTYLGQDKPYHGYKDQHLIYHLLNEGKGFILNFNGAVYRENRGGIHGRTPVIQQSRLAVQVAQELYQYNGKTAVLKKNLIQTLDWAIECEKRCDGGSKRVLCSFVIQRFLLVKSIRRMIRQLWL